MRILLYFVLSSIPDSSRNAFDFGRLQAWLERCDGWTVFLRLLDELFRYLWFLYRGCPIILQPPLGPLVITQYIWTTQSYLGSWAAPSATQRMHPLSMCAGHHLSFHPTLTALLWWSNPCISFSVASHVQMSFYMNIHLYFSYFKLYHPDIDDFKSHLTMLLATRLSIGHCSAIWCCYNTNIPLKHW